MRDAGDVTFTDVNRQTGEGIVEYSNEKDMRTALDKFDDVEFSNRFDKGFIRVKPENPDMAVGGRSRSPPRRSRSRSRSPARDASPARRSRSASRERSASPAPRDEEKPRSRSRSASPPRDD
jgi:hypothetical protein